MFLPVTVVAAATNLDFYTEIAIRYYYYDFSVLLCSNNARVFIIRA